MASYLNRLSGVSMPGDPAVTRVPGAAPAALPAPVNDTDSFGAGGVNPTGAPSVAAPTGVAQTADPATVLNRSAVRTANTNIPYQAERAATNADTTATSNAAPTHRAEIELPFIGDIPGIGNTLEGGFSGVQRAGLGFAEEVVDNPGLALATGGLSGTVAANDAFADDVATGVARDLTGNNQANVNVPGTPQQVLDDLLKPAGNAIVDGANAVGGAIGSAVDGIGDFFGGGGLNGGGGGVGGVGGVGGTNDWLQTAANNSTASKALGRDVIAGRVAPGGAGADLQANALAGANAFTNGPRATQGALDNNAAFRSGPQAVDAAAGAVSNYQAGPRAQDSTVAGLDQFLQAPEGPSKARILLDEGAQGAMADVLSASRSGRARDAGSQARQSAVAQGEIAGMGVDNARSAGLLRAQEADDFRKQQLGGLQAKGGLAQGIDQGTLEALGLGSTLASDRDANTLGSLNLEGDLSRGLDLDTLSGLGLGSDLSTSMRNANVTERADSLNFGANLEQTGATQQGDVLKTIPQLEQIRHDDQYELTPQQKLQLAALGAGGDLLSSFF